MTKRVAAPCLSCGTTGGLRRRHGWRPARLHGLCRACAGRAEVRGTYHDYPACGAVPVPSSGAWWTLTPAALPATMTPQELGYHLHHDANGRPLPRHMTMGALWIPEAEIAAAEEYADEWLRDHPWQTCDWDAPDAARAA